MLAPASLQSRVTPFEIVCALGLACNFVWCTLEGHSEGFMPAANGLDLIVNSRLFFQLGFLLAAVAMLVGDRALARAERTLACVVPAASSLGTLAYALSFSQTHVDPMVFCIAGLVLSGFGYCWLVARFYLMIVRERGFISAVVATTLCLIIKELLLVAILGMVSPVVHIAIATAMPVCMALLCLAASRLAGDRSASVRTRGSSDSPNSAKGTAAGRSIQAQAVILALLLATIRGFSQLGMWGGSADGIVAGPHPLLSAGIAIVFVILFAIAALIAPAHLPPAAHFRPAVLILFAGMFLIVFQAYAGSNAAPMIVLQVEELLAHLSFWAVTCMLLHRVACTMRTVSVPLVVYSATSILLVFLESRATALGIAFVLLVTYLIFAFVTRPRSLDVEPPASSIELHDETAPADKLASAMGHACANITACYGLSPREAQILPLLAEGRSRSYICERLSLSDSTVKTHISHIYSKCSVSGHQGLVDLLFGMPGPASEGEDPREP